MRRRLRLRHLIRLIVPLAALATGFLFEIPPVTVALNVAGQPVPIVLSGTIAQSSESTFDFNLRADLAALQDHITPLLQDEVNQSERCGDRIAIQHATLDPAAPAGRLTVQLHFEKWACFKLMGKESAKRLVGGDGSVELLIRPAVEQGNAIRLDAEVGRIDANGSLGELLRSGSVGNALREKIRASLLKAVRKASNFETMLPPEAQPYLTIASVAFGDTGAGRLALHAAGKLDVPPEKAAGLLETFRGRK